MQLHQLKPKHKLKKKKRVGRGGKRGTYSGKGIKGQKSRAGRKFAPVIRELIKKHPKLRGYRQKSPAGSGKKPKTVILNLAVLEKEFNSGEKITPKILFKKKLIRRIGKKTPEVKILAKGKLTKALAVEGCQVSKTAKEAIEKAGGTVKISNF